MLRRLGSGLAALAVASVTACAVVLTASPAHASTITPIPPDLIKVGEAVKHAGPGVAARNATKATSLIPGPVGVAMRIASLGMTAFQTQDYWLPFVAGAIDGEGGEAMQPGPVGGVSYVVGLDQVGTTQTGINIAVAIEWTQAPGGTMGYAASWTCQLPNGATTTQSVQSGFSAPNAGTPTPLITGFNVTPGEECSGAGVVVKEFHLDGTLAPSANVGTYDYTAQVTAEQLRSEVTCRKPSGETYTVVRTTTRTLTEQSEGTEWLQVAACQAGDTPVNVEVSSVTGGTTKTIGDYPLSPTDETHDQQYPLCAGTECLYRIKVDGNFCTTGVEACTHWSYIWSQQSYRVECFYGAYAVAVSECLFMERAYDTATGARTGTKANTDGDPETYTPPAPAPPRTTTTTSPSPSSSSSASPSPSSSVTPSTGVLPPGQPNPQPPADPAGARCFPSGWAVFNPFEWVYRPVMCALKDAFVPDPTLTTSRLTNIRTKLDTKGPGPAIAQVSALIESVPAGGGCQGPGMTINLAGSSRTLYLFNACTEPMSTAAGYSYALATVVLVIGGGLSVVRAIASAFGLNVSVGRGTPDGQ